MAWIESHQSLARHPKVVRLASILRVSKPDAIGRLHLLWWWALDYAQDGNLSNFSNSEIAAAAEWTKDADSFVSALLTCNLLDQDKKIHDWDEYAGRLVEIRKKDAQRKRDVRRMSTGCPTAVQPPSIVPNPTQPNPTQPFKKKNSVLTEGNCITLSMCLDWHKQAVRNGADYTEEEVHQAFLFFQANGWMLGKNPVVDYRAAIETKIGSNRDHRGKPTSSASGTAWAINQKIEGLKAKLKQVQSQGVITDEEERAVKDLKRQIQEAELSKANIQV